MSVELTPPQLDNYLNLKAKIEWRNEHPNLTPKDRELEILELLREDVSVNKICKTLKTTHETVNKIRKAYGMWGA